MTKRISMSVSGMALLALLVATACGGADEPAAPTQEATPAKAEPTPPPPAVAVDLSGEAKALFDLRCTGCHGALGVGDGPRAGSLAAPPRNYRDPEWQDSVTDERIKQVVLHGSEAVGLSGEMPGNPDLESQDALLDALVQHVRSFRR